uniref:Uncharacterized protein n=1 Tax=Oryza sativa subsp. japonica TaxID=39947 RepID=Q8S5Q9_ORYSJ|nr:unknown protein [Oryza sativa Japonica Group]
MAAGPPPPGAAPPPWPAAACHGRRPVTGHGPAGRQMGRGGWAGKERGGGRGEEEVEDRGEDRMRKGRRWRGWIRMRM